MIPKKEAIKFVKLFKQKKRDRDNLSFLKHPIRWLILDWEISNMRTELLERIERSCAECELRKYE